MTGGSPSSKKILNSLGKFKGNDKN
eukprot:CCRYP_009842-RC/>CCRYP_009842-RC protein AED:0.49 eAED:0.41 QI:0/-1/0/1/-1/0/1/0/24